MIRLEKVSKCFEDKQVISDVSLALSAHQVHVLLGPSGCGKSTLLRLMLGLIRQDSGKIWLGDALVEAHAVHAATVGYVIQDGGLFPHLTGWKNLEIVSNLQSWPRDRLLARAKALMEMTDMDLSLLERYPKALSGGQRQRLSLIRALFLDPPFLFLDEPMGALDPVVRRSLQLQLKKLFKKLNKTVVLVTHDLAEAAFFGDSMTLLHRGRVLQHGSWRELNENPADSYVRVFIDAQKPLVNEGTTP